MTQTNHLPCTMYQVQLIHVEFYRHYLLSAISHFIRFNNFLMVWHYYIDVRISKLPSTAASSSPAKKNSSFRVSLLQYVSLARWLSSVSVIISPINLHDGYGTMTHDWCLFWFFDSDNFRKWTHQKALLRWLILCVLFLFDRKWR